MALLSYNIALVRAMLLTRQGALTSMGKTLKATVVEGLLRAMLLLSCCIEGEFVSRRLSLWTRLTQQRSGAGSVKKVKRGRLTL